MSDDALVAVVTIAIVLVAVSVGGWLGLRLVKRADLKNSPDTLKKITVGIWIAASVMLAFWAISGGALSIQNACFAFVLVVIAMFAVFSRQKGV